METSNSMKPNWPLKGIGDDGESSCMVKFMSGNGVLMFAPEPWVMRQPFGSRRPVSWPWSEIACEVAWVDMVLRLLEMTRLLSDPSNIERW